MFINSALAQAATETASAVSAGAPGVVSSAATMGGMSDGMRLFVQFALIIVIFYFLLLRPQQKRMKAHAQMLAGIEKGSKVIVGGLIGKVVKVEDERELVVEFAKDVQVKVLRAYVSQVLDEEGDLKKEAASKADNK